MKTIDNIIKLWANWKPSVDYVCPSSVTSYYWHYYVALKKNRPLFRDGEINDVCAVMSHSKPAALFATPCEVKQHPELQELIKVSQERNVFYSVTKMTNFYAHVFSSNNSNALIQNALANFDSEQMGILLGYPREAVALHVQKSLEWLKKHGIMELSKPEAVDVEYMKKHYPNKPEFVPPKEWFV